MITAEALAALPPWQQARRQRVIETAIELAARSGYDGVRMCDVALAADVAVGTVYRYFASKDHLLAAAMAELTGALRDRITARPPTGGSMADQLTDVYRRATRALERRPKLTAAMVTALSSPDARVEASAAVVRTNVATMSEAILSGLDPEIRTEVISVVGHVFYSTLTGWAHGRHPFTHVIKELEEAIRLLLTPYDSSGRLRCLSDRGLPDDRPQ